MIKRLDITGVHLQVGDDLKKYVIRKIGRLDRFLPTSVRSDVHVEVKLKENKAKDKNGRTCEVIVHLPHETITIKETTINMFAAIDIAETKLRMALKKYKELHGGPRMHQRILARFKRQLA